jgi:hypothetical protein
MERSEAQLQLPVKEQLSMRAIAREVRLNVQTPSNRIRSRTLAQTTSHAHLWALVPQKKPFSIRLIHDTTKQGYHATLHEASKCVEDDHQRSELYHTRLRAVHIFLHVFLCRCQLGPFGISLEALSREQPSRREMR